MVVVNQTVLFEISGIVLLDTVNTVIHNMPQGGSTPHIDDVDSGITRQRSLNNFEPMIRPSEPISPPPEGKPVYIYINMSMCTLLCLCV